MMSGVCDRKRRKISDRAEHNFLKKQNIFFKRTKQMKKIVKYLPMTHIKQQIISPNNNLW
jgi:hypothetical protein